MAKPNYLITILLLLIFQLAVKGQVRPENNVSNVGQQQGRNVDISQRQKEKVDINIKIWSLLGDGTFFVENDLDTLQESFQIFNPIYKNSITSTYTGNYGGAYIDNNYFRRQYLTEFFFANNHDAFILTPERIDYFNTTVPYTIFDYSQSESQNTQNETRFNVIHSQNVNEKLNFTFRYDQAKSEGQYNYQANKNSSVTLYSSYHGDKVNVHGGFISNMIKNTENGGMANDADFFEDEPADIIFRLVNAKSEYKTNFFFATTEYKIGKHFTETHFAEDGEEVATERFKPYVGFIHKFEFQNNLKTFNESDGANVDYYANTYLDSATTFDSIKFNKLTNLFQLKQYENTDRKTSFGKRAYLGVDFVKTLMPSHTENTLNSDTYNSIYIGGGIFREFGKFWKWNIDGRLYTVGYKSGQTEINGTITKPVFIFKDSLAAIEIKGSLQNLVPDLFQEKFSSNHFYWNNSNFGNTQRMDAQFKFTSPKNRLEAGANYALINNFVYINQEGVPAQTTEDLLIFGAYLNKDISLKNFNVKSKFLVQQASNERYIHLPAFSSLVSMYYKFIWSKVLFTQIGTDIRYNTAFYADAYDPSTGLFYLQNEKKIGNYPYIDLYASLKLKRTRVFFKWMNVGSDFLNKEYFGALHHPMNRRTFRLGVAWIWYD